MSNAERLQQGLVGAWLRLIVPFECTGRVAPDIMVLQENYQSLSCKLSRHTAVLSH